MVTGSKKPILIVDDDDDNRGLLSALLSEIGYSVVEAKNGSRALDLLVSERQIEPCLIVLDLHMPEMSGREFLAVVCSYVRLSRIPVIVLTGSEQEAGEPIKHGAVQGCFRKPMEVEPLLEAVRRVAGDPVPPSSRPSSA
jgi:CheY-like chemotaxis protein